MKIEDMLANLRAGKKISSPGLGSHYIYYDTSTDIVRHSNGNPFEFGFLSLDYGWYIWYEHGFYSNLVKGDGAIYYYSDGWAKYCFDGDTGHCDYEVYNLKEDWNWYSCSAPENPELIMQTEDKYQNYEVYFGVRKI